MNESKTVKKLSQQGPSKLLLRVRSLVTPTYRFSVSERTLSMTEGKWGRVRGGGLLKVLQIFHKIFRSLGDHRPKYLMDH